MNLQGTPDCKEPPPQSGERERGDGWKRGSIQLSSQSVSMAMAPEAGQNFLSGNKQRLPFTTARAMLGMWAAALSGPRGPRWGVWGPGLPAFLLSAALRGAGESGKLPRKDRVGAAAGLEGSSAPCWSHAGGTVASHHLGDGCGSCPPALLLLVGSTKDGVLSPVTAA